MSIQSLLSNQRILSGLPSGGGGSLTFTSPLENESGIVSLVLGNNFKVNGSELSLNTNNVGTENQMLVVGESGVGLTWVSQPTSVPLGGSVLSSADPAVFGVAALVSNDATYYNNVANVRIRIATTIFTNTTSPSPIFALTSNFPSSIIMGMCGLTEQAGGGGETSFGIFRALPNGTIELQNVNSWLTTSPQYIDINYSYNTL